MKKTLITTLLLCMTAVTVSAQLLYKISGKDLPAPSYIVGTYHVAPASFVDSIPGIRQAMADCQQTYDELIMTQALSADSAALFQQAMMLPDSLTIDKVLSADQMNRLNAYMKKEIGADMTNSFIFQQMGRMTPSSLNTTLSLLSHIKKEGKFNPENAIDTYFQKEALAQGKAIGGLETIEFQINILYKGKSMERQIEELMCLIDNEMTEEMTDKLAKAYYSQDINAIMEAVNMKQNNSCDPTPEEEAQLIYDRNADWVKKMPAIMRQKPTLFAVGVAHLPGPKGVLTLLRNAGYQVEAVKGKE